MPALPRGHLRRRRRRIRDPKRPEDAHGTGSKPQTRAVFPGVRVGPGSNINRRNSKRSPKTAGGALEEEEPS